MKLCTAYYKNQEHEPAVCEKCQVLIREIRTQIEGHEAMVAKLQARLLNAYRKP